MSALKPGSIWGGFQDNTTISSGSFECCLAVRSTGADGSAVLKNKSHYIKQNQKKYSLDYRTFSNLQKLPFSQEQHNEHVVCKVGVFSSPILTERK